MEEEKEIEFAREAYVLSRQIGELENTMSKSKSAVSGYPSYAKNFNTILERSKEILKGDEIIFRTIAQVTPYNPGKEFGYIVDFEGIKADLSVLKGALHSFFEFHFPKKEKEKMGFI